MGCIIALAPLNSVPDCARRAVQRRATDGEGGTFIDLRSLAARRAAPAPFSVDRSELAALAARAPAARESLAVRSTPRVSDLTATCRCDPSRRVRRCWLDVCPQFNPTGWPRARSRPALAAIRRSNSAIGRLDHHLGSGPASATAAAITHGSFATRTELNFSPAAFYHRTSTMKVDPDVLSIHNGRLLFMRAKRWRRPELSFAQVGTVTRERTPRSFIASDLGMAKSRRRSATTPRCQNKHAAG
jgi:hypothetical protein